MLITHTKIKNRESEDGLEDALTSNINKVKLGEKTQTLNAIPVLDFNIIAHIPMTR